MEASAPTAAHIEPEPSGWQPRAIWVSARMLCGAASFFFLAFLFAYFYLRSLDPNKSWKIGAVNPSAGLGVAIVVCLLVSAVVLRLGALRRIDALRAGIAALGLALLSVLLQCIEYTTLGFGPASGGYASVFVGWTATYALFTLACAYWIETQIATLWRAQREGIKSEVPADEADLLQAGVEACSFFWGYYVAIGVIAYVILYLL
jgi:heme/copper-type cytochrome/quinol oxidase subunit 3